MPTKIEIKDKYKKFHNDLSKSYYSGTSGLTKEQFDTQHTKVWSDMEAELKLASDYVAPIPVRDLAAEIDDLKARIERLEKIQVKL